MYIQYKPKIFSAPATYTMVPTRSPNNLQSFLSIGPAFGNLGSRTGSVVPDLELNSN
ncbi:unnamed protein product [Staurois parvus]|uniref:Uncharacterized protein n=1 Tax=Staurois parvus TaxID=386267 RepID=A0ABN9AMF8_9NEOB|nr:unnamed protein product [Staurois parvus]